MPHNLQKCSALRIRAVVNKFIQERMDFRYSGDWTVWSGLGIRFLKSKFGNLGSEHM